MNVWSSCAWVPFHDRAEDRPFGPECGKPATHLIVWEDGRRSPACSEHLNLEDDAPRHVIVELASRER